MRLAVILYCAWGAAQAWGQANTLSSKEKTEGWVLLFDGKTLNGWEPKGTAEWKAADGALVSEGPKAGYLATTGTFDNFVLSLEFRTGANTNSGIYLRASKEGSPRQTGYELQIRDFQEPNENPVYLTGSLVRHAVASGAKIVPGQWNRFEVAANGDHFVVMYNGAKVLDAHDKKSASGILGLEFNNAKVEFRNLKLKRL
jgi:Domain of Unknown Function (DUF1080)